MLVAETASQQPWPIKNTHCRFRSRPFEISDRRNLVDALRGEGHRTSMVNAAKNASLLSGHILSIDSHRKAHHMKRRYHSTLVFSLRLYRIAVDSASSINYERGFCRCAEFITLTHCQSSTACVLRCLTSCLSHHRPEIITVLVYIISEVRGWRRKRPEPSGTGHVACGQLRSSIAATFRRTCIKARKCTREADRESRRLQIR